MKNIIVVSLIIHLLVGSTGLFAQKQPVDYVNVFTGTSNSRWMLGPYAYVPYGMVQLGPDNQSEGWMAGYEYSISNVTAFSHIHAWTMAGLSIMPAIADFTNFDGAVSFPYLGATAGYHSRILKHSEKAWPGYYSCFLYDVNCKAEMTATAHCGFHRYTFKDSGKVRIILDLAFPAESKVELIHGTFRKLNDTTLVGSADYFSGGFNRFKLHFLVLFNKPFQSFNGWVKNSLKHRIETVEGSSDVGSWVEFQTKKEEVLMIKVSLSLVDLEGARKNMESELVPFLWNFSKIAHTAKDQWNKLLSKIIVEGDESDKIKFYTNLYRSFAKQAWNDVDGRYRDPFERIQQLPVEQPIYGGDGLWNSFWTYNGLLSMIDPERMNNWVLTQLELFDKTGWTSSGPAGIELSGIMEVTPEIALMVAAYQKGIRNYDTAKLYRAVIHNSTEQGRRLNNSGLAGMERLDIYNRLGYVPVEMDAASRTLDYAYADYCAAQLAKSFHYKKDFDFLISRSSNWKNQFHPELKWQVPRDSSGNWITNYDVFAGRGWIEGNGWQYTWYVPHDVPGLINLMGKALFNKRLEEGFKKSEKNKFTAYVFDRGQNDAFEFYVNHGNEVNMQASFLFNYSGKPWLTQKYCRAIQEEFYNKSPLEGWRGDEDEGNMSAWFVMTAMGLFEMNGGVTEDPMVDLTTPLFRKITIHLDKKYYKGEKFTIIVKNQSKKNKFIQSVKLNNKKIDTPAIKFRSITNGGTMEIVAGSEPNYSWGQ